MSFHGGQSRWQVRGYGTHHPPQTHEKYNYIWNDPYWKLIGNWQDSYATKALRRIHMYLGKKWRTVIRLGTLSLGGDWEEKGEYRSRRLPWEWAGWDPDCVFQSWSPTRRRQDPLAVWRTTESDGKTGEAWTVLMSSALMSPRQDADISALEDASFLTADSLCTPAWANTPALLTPRHRVHWIWGCEDQEEDWTWSQGRAWGRGWGGGSGGHCRFLLRHSLRSSPDL